MLLILTLEIAVFITAHLLTHRAYAAVIRESPCPQRWNSLTPAFLYALDKLDVWRRATGWSIRLHHLHTALIGTRHALAETKLSMARMALTAYGSLVGFTLLGFISDSSHEVLLFGAISAAVTPFIHLRLLDERLRRRKRAMLLELPELVTQILLLTNAGETVQQALALVVERHGRADRALLKELSQAIHELRMNVSLAKALDDFQKRCGVQEVTVFVSTLMLHYKRGGDDLSVALRTLSKELWDKRKSLSRTLGEEASSKLVFPMVIVFVVILIVIASPAVMLMNANS
ncbi:type II secretion system F family protein [Paenibacillus chartarius]|uniref:Type II secretion system F family protein n=1 Tax=Paenibacillus chartarius TaxID=747481 RepID=A0ABV6DPX2_9BACL